MLRILDSDTLNITDTITDYTSVVFNLNFYEPGDFTVTLPPFAISESIKKNAYVMYKGNLGIIKYISVTDTATTIKGVDIKGILKQRICKGAWSGNVETVIKTIVSENTQDNRSFPLFEISESKNQGEETTYESKGKTVADAIGEICKDNGVGYSVKLENKKLVFDVVLPQNRDCIYSIRHRNISSSEYTLDSLSETNTAFNFFQNEGLELSFNSSGYLCVGKGKCRLSDGSIFVNEETITTSIYSGTSTNAYYVAVVNEGNGIFSVKSGDKTYINNMTAKYGLGSYYQQSATTSSRDEDIYFSENENAGLERTEVYSDNYEKTIEYENGTENATANIVTFSDYGDKWNLGDTVKIRLDLLGKRITLEQPITSVQIVCEATNKRITPTFGETKNILKKLIKELKNNAG